MQIDKALKSSSCGHYEKRRAKYLGPHNDVLTAMLALENRAKEGSPLTKDEERKLVEYVAELPERDLIYGNMALTFLRSLRCRGKKSLQAKCQHLALLAILCSERPGCERFVWAADVAWGLYLWYTALSGVRKAQRVREHEQVLEELARARDLHPQLGTHPTLKMLSEGRWSTTAVASAIAGCVSDTPPGVKAARRTVHYASVELAMRLLAAHCALSPVREIIVSLTKDESNKEDVLFMLGYMQEVSQRWWNPLRVNLLTRWLCGDAWEHLLRGTRAAVTPVATKDIWRVALAFLDVTNDLHRQILSNETSGLRTTLGMISSHALVLSELDYSIEWYSGNVPEALQRPGQMGPSFLWH
jgi:hypothetical protein